MDGVKKESFRLRIKGSAGLKDPRPEKNKAGKCYACSKWSENLNKQDRCGTDECEALVEGLAEDHWTGDMHISAWDQKTLDKITMIKTELIMLEQKQQVMVEEKAMESINARTIWNNEKEDRVRSVDESGFNCSCGRGLKMPNQQHCAVCHREENHSKMKQYRQRKRTGNTNTHIVSHAKIDPPTYIKNPIRGLKGVKLDKK